MINCTILTKPDYKNGQVHDKCIFNGKIPQIPPKECGIEVGENGIEPIYSMSYNVTKNHLEIVINFIDNDNRYEEVEL